MKAIVYTEYGSPDVFRLQDVEKPVPKEKEILIKVHATSVNYGDLITRKFGAISPREFNMPGLFWFLARLSFGFRKPKKQFQILGAEFSGSIEATGAGVTRFEVGAPVFGFRGPEFGGNAEYLCMPEDGKVALKPANLSFEEAATIPYGALTALNLLRKVGIRPGQKVLILGASGSIGSAAVQLAKDWGAHVTGVCATAKLAFVKSLGADKVIDYTREDFTRNGETYDVIFDILGKSSFSQCRNALTINGSYLLASFKLPQLLRMLWTRMTGGKRVICALSMDTAEDLVFIKELVEAGKIRSVIDKQFPLEQVADAHRYVEAGQKTGSIVIRVEHDQRVS